MPPDAQLAAHEPGGIFDQTLYGLMDSLSAALFAPESHWSKSTREAALDAGFTPSPPVWLLALQKSVASEAAADRGLLPLDLATANVLHSPA